jgi:hypothetical protein
MAAPGCNTHTQRGGPSRVVLTHRLCVTGMWLRVAEWSHYRLLPGKTP